MKVVYKGKYPVILKCVDCHCEVKNGDELELSEKTFSELGDDWVKVKPEKAEKTKEAN